MVIANVDNIILDFSGVFNKVINNKDACADVALLTLMLADRHHGVVPHTIASPSFYRDAGPRIADNP